MATSRTGTATWKRIAVTAKKRAKAAGQDRCPDCGTMLDYDQGLLPNSAEADHIIPHAKGGQDSLDNARVCCRRCNQSKGDRMTPKALTVLAVKPLRSSRAW